MPEIPVLPTRPDGSREEQLAEVRELLQSIEVHLVPTAVPGLPEQPLPKPQFQLWNTETFRVICPRALPQDPRRLAYHKLLSLREELLAREQQLRIV